MKVYVLLSDAAYDYEDEQDVSVYSEYEDAKKAFNECVEEEMRNDHLVGRSDTVIVHHDDYFSIYKDGEYSADHYTVRIYERELPKTHKVKHNKQTTILLSYRQYEEKVRKI